MITEENLVPGEIIGWVSGDHLILCLILDVEIERSIRGTSIFTVTWLNLFLGQYNKVKITPDIFGYYWPLEEAVDNHKRYARNRSQQ